MAKYNVYIQYNGEELFNGLNGVKIKVNDLLSFDELEFSTRQEDDEVFFRRELSGSISFLRCNNESIFDLIKDFFNDSALNCEVIDITIDKICENELPIVDYWSGTFTANQCSINLCTNRVDIQPLLNDEYSCILNNYNNEFSEWYVYSNTVVKNTTEVEFIRQSITICGQIGRTPSTPPPTPEILMTNNPDLYDDDDIFATGPRPDITGYQIYTSQGCFSIPTIGNYAQPRGLQQMPYWFVDTNEITELGGGVTDPYWEYSTTWHRDYLVTNSNPFDFGDGWLFIGFNGVSNVYFRKPVGGGVNYPSNVTYKYGAKLDEVFNSFLSDCGFNVCSFFFDIDSEFCDGASPINAPYSEQYHNLTIHAKSDVKRPFTDGRTQQSQWIYTLKKLFEMVRKTYNVYWFINENGYVQLEHISYFDKDVTDLECTNVCNLSLVEDRIPSKITTRWMEDNGLSFDYGFVQYDPNCDDIGEVSLTIDDFSANIIAMYENDRYSNEGFVIIDNNLIDGELQVRLNNFNNSLPFLKTIIEGWQMLLPEYLVNGFNPDNPISSITLKPKKESNDIICGCECEINPLTKVNTSIGVGEILSVTEKLRSGFYKIKFGYE